MAQTQSQLGLTDTGADQAAGKPVQLRITFDSVAGCVAFEWLQPPTQEVKARGDLWPAELSEFQFSVLEWRFAGGHNGPDDSCSAHVASVRALLNRIRKLFPLAEGPPQFLLSLDADRGPGKKGETIQVRPPPNEDAWRWLTRQTHQVATMLDAPFAPEGDPAARGRAVLRLLACALLGVPPNAQDWADQGRPLAPAATLLHLTVTFNQVKGFAELVWNAPADRSAVATGRVRLTGGHQLTWELETGDRREPSITSLHRNSIRAQLGAWLKQFPTNRDTFAGFWVQPNPAGGKPLIQRESPFSPRESPIAWVEDNIVAMAEALRFESSPLGRVMKEMSPVDLSEFERHERRLLRKENKRAEEERRRQETMARLAEERRQRERRAAQERKLLEARKTAQAKKSAQHGSPAATAGDPKSRLSSLNPTTRPPPPPVPVRIEFPDLTFQETAFPLADLRGYLLTERAALWWISNQSDDLLCLPHCRIERLDYQLRTALRVLGPLRGRALLSDEVGLGKTIEAGLVLKELLTRGMVRRFLVLTVPSLVDQWEEELSDKFGLATATTNQAGARSDAHSFWRENTGLIASLHTLKQPAHLEVARQIHWDLLIVDEAHYLRNRESQAWQAVNALPRQFLLLLTATPVQNSLEELCNLVALLQPGQLPSPKEFRARFVDPKRPRQPREPEELRRLLGQVMIRNTRANAGLKLPPRRAETVLFQPDPAERAFWQHWETEFRARLADLSASHASLWGRLLLQAAGSSPAAWRSALESFPERTAARRWRDQAPLESSWKRKCELLLPLTRGEGGAVIFTQFLETQAALAEFLRGAAVETFVINGATPPPERHPITEQFHKRGGALLLTHSGTEGRNLQFCHRLANFDLPWNPMEIEQRIGRLHRLGQQQTVRIYNFVQAGTLQEHLLEVLQEKLNLFELVVGETGLVLGERFSSDEFANEVLRRWRDNEGQVAEAFSRLGDELATARDAYAEVKQLDDTLFAKDYETL
jgi:SNF2 family DNA or RNA helicase